MFQETMTLEQIGNLTPFQYRWVICRERDEKGQLKHWTSLPTPEPDYEVRFKQKRRWQGMREWDVAQEWAIQWAKIQQYHLDIVMWSTTHSNFAAGAPGLPEPPWETDCYEAPEVGQRKPPPCRIKTDSLG
jgi:hypothetical protein